MTWYSIATPEEKERLLGAWSDAPIENVELCSMLLDVARQQVVAFAVDEDDEDTPLDPDPVTVDLLTPSGNYSGTQLHGSITFSRVGAVVTASLQFAPPADLGGPGYMERSWQDIIPEGFRVIAPAIVGMWGEDGGVSLTAGGSDDVPYSPSYLKVYAEGTPTTSLEWATGDDATAGIPNRYVYAQLQQAQNLWNAGRASGDGNVGAEGYTFQPRPLDKTIRQIIRPTTGAASVF